MSDDSAAIADRRLGAIEEVLARLAAGDFAARGELAGHDHALDRVMRGVEQLGEVLERQHATNAEAERRAGELLDMMIRMAARDFAARAPIYDGESIFDALASGLNMLADEFVAAQEDHARLQQEIIQTQAAMIQELSTPLIPISNDVLVMPLIGRIDTGRAQLVLERLLDGVVASQAHTVILDITGVAIVDTHVANTLVRAARAVQLLGAQVVLTGIRPEVAQTLVGLGVDLGGLVTWSTMQMGIAQAIRRAAKPHALSVEA